MSAAGLLGQDAVYGILGPEFFSSTIPSRSLLCVVRVLTSYSES